jgi:hypothetical protein
MTIERIREAPSQLPHARLYIDDIREIENIIRGAFGNSEGISFEYIVDESLRISTADELLAHGSYCTDFVLVLCGEHLNIRQQPILRFLKSGHPRFTAPYDLSEQEFELYGRIRVVFEDRALKLTNALRNLPSWLTYPFQALSFVYVIIAFELTRSRHIALAWMVACLSVIGASMWWLTDFRKSRVYLTRHREDTLAKKQRRDERIEKLLWLLVGVGIGSVATIITQHFSGKR